jgi:hypothetical protein
MQQEARKQDSELGLGAQKNQESRDWEYNTT